MKKKIFFMTSGFLLTSLITASTVLSITSCSQEATPPAPVESIKYKDKKISEFIDNFWNEYNSIIGDNNFFQITDDNINRLINLVDSYIKQAKQYYYYELSFDGKIWLNSFLEDLMVKKELLMSNIHYLIINSNFQLGFTNYSSWLINRINYAINKFKTDNTILNRFITFIDKVQKNMTTGLEKAITPSQIIVKHAVGSLLQSDFMLPILDFCVENNYNASTPNLYEMLKSANRLPFKDSTDSVNSHLIEKANKKLISFIYFLVIRYYPSISYGMTSNSTYLVQKTLTDVENNSYSYVKEENSQKNTYYINGLGLSDSDLETNDIGIGFMPNGSGIKIYNALLKLHSSTSKSAKEIFNLGHSNVNNIIHNMKEVAKIVAQIYVGENNNWSPKNEYYDKDSSGDEFGSELADSLLENIVTANGDVDLAKFFIWMNTDRWFNGRDMQQNQFPSLDGNNLLLSDYQIDDGNNPNKQLWEKEKNNGTRSIPYKYISQFNAKNTNITSVKISDVIGEKNNNIDFTVVNGDAGNLSNKYLSLGLSPATIQNSNKITNITQKKSISPEAAFIGASQAVDQYLGFKDATSNHLSSMFFDTSVDYTLRTGVGGAAYASSGQGSWSYSNDGWGGFYLDINPYFGLQKWSMSTLSVHESITGHVFQFNYAHDHKKYEYLPEFSITAYGEGWGLFSEWLAVQAGLYGEPNKITTDSNIPLPNFGVNSKNVNVEQYKNKYDYANGAYWVENENKNSQKLFDALQYFGFLNERQLRAMRCAVDVGIHAGVNQQSIGEFQRNSGWSLSKARQYLKSNSALGIDDIKRETKRYLEYPGQAVSYYNGLSEIEKIFITAKDKYESKNQNKPFLDWQNPKNTKNNTAYLFDLILRNNDIPLVVLNQICEFYIREYI